LLNIGRGLTRGCAIIGVGVGNDGSGIIGCGGLTGSTGVLYIGVGVMENGGGLTGSGSTGVNIGGSIGAGSSGSGGVGGVGTIVLGLFKPKYKNTSSNSTTTAIAIFSVVIFILFYY
jgi:hypothetical protein